MSLVAGFGKCGGLVFSALGLDSSPGQGHRVFFLQEKCFLVKPNKNLGHSPKFQPLKCRSSLWNSSPKKKIHIVSLILNSTPQPCHIFVMSFHPGDFVQMASDKPFDYHSGLLLLLSCIILSQTCSKFQTYGSEDGEVDNPFEKNTFYWPCEECKVSCRFFFFLPIGHFCVLAIVLRLACNGGSCREMSVKRD